MWGILEKDLQCIFSVQNLMLETTALAFRVLLLSSGKIWSVRWYLCISYNKSIAYRTMTVKTRYFRVVGQEGVGVVVAKLGSRTWHSLITTAVRPVAVYSQVQTRVARSVFGSSRHVQWRYERPHKSNTSHRSFLFLQKLPERNHYLECVFPLFTPNSPICMCLSEDKHRETLEEKSGSKFKKKKKKHFLCWVKITGLSDSKSSP